jgi:alpha-L-fucosidase 2
LSLLNAYFLKPPNPYNLFYMKMFLKASSILSLVLFLHPGFSQIANTASLIDKREFDPSTLLWYQSPATAWEEALPVGNGRLGAMVFGKNGEERIQLNDDTYWSGGPYSTVVKDGYKKLPEIQKDIFEGRPLEAHKLFGRYLMGYPVEQQKYQSLADLIIKFANEKDVTEYKRWLDLKTGVTSVKYKVNGVTYQREVFASVPDQTIAIRITADRPGSISFSAQLRGVRNNAHSNYATDYFRMDGMGNDGLVLTGKSADYLGVEGKLRYEARLKAETDGGLMKVEAAELIVENANSVTLYFVNATNFVNYKDVSADHHAKVEQYLRNIASKTYAGIREAAVKDYQSLFNRVSLSLPATDNSYLATDARIKNFAAGSDPQLASLSYQFGRYLLISSSRPGTQPANLQGIWNGNMNPSWDSKYTTNINTQMNYWPVESANLSELAEPLIQMVTELTDQGSLVAKEHYGAGGWVLHQNTDLWRVAAPMDGPTWGTFTVGGAWLTTQLWEHYLFTQDTNYLKKIYPVLKGSVQFFLDFLVEYPKNKNWLITNPSTSPENPPKGPGYRYFFDEVTSMYYFTTICAGASIDMQILTDLFADYLAATKVLKLDPVFADQVARAKARLVPPQIGADGMLQEWAEDLEQMEAKHRHSSHLYGIYPGNVISVKKTPSFIEPVKKVLEQRGDEGAGFSRAWKMNIWARLYDGNRAYQIFKGYIDKQAYPQLFAKCFTPLQVDGSLGVTAGINEMLIQSHEGVLDFLPALPDEWSSGEIKGARARGAFTIDLGWKDKKITKAVIFSSEGGICRIQEKTPVLVTSNGKKITVKNAGNGVLEFPTQKGGQYEIQARR